MKGQPFLYAEMGDWIVELHRDMPDRMSGIETRKIFLNIIEAFSNRLVDVGIRHRNREWTFELSPLIDELHRLLFGGCTCGIASAPNFESPHHDSTVRPEPDPFQSSPSVPMLVAKYPTRERQTFDPIGLGHSDRSNRCPCLSRGRELALAPRRRSPGQRRPEQEAAQEATPSA